MTPIAGLSLTEAEHAIEAAHQGWHVWHSREDDGTPARICATTTACAAGGTGTTLDAPSVERIEEAIGAWEHKHPQAVTA